MYYKGEGVKQNYQEALKWLQKAADNGIKEAKELIVKIKLVKDL
jgi:TPR repeat protein